MLKVAKLLKKKEFSFLKTVHNFCNLKNAHNRHSLVSMRNCELKVKILMKRKTKSWTGSSTFKVNGSVCVALVSFLFFLKLTSLLIWALFYFLFKFIWVFYYVFLNSFCGSKCSFTFLKHSSEGIIVLTVWGWFFFLC